MTIAEKVMKNIIEEKELINDGYEKIKRISFLPGMGFNLLEIDENNNEKDIYIKKNNGLILVKWKNKRDNNNNMIEVPFQHLRCILYYINRNGYKDE